MLRRMLLFGMLFWAVAAFSSPVTMMLVFFNGPYVNGIPTYPYTLSYAASSRFFAMCNDYYHGGAVGDTWLANLTNLGSGDLTNLRFASEGLVAYQEAGWIFLQTYATSSSQWPDMNFAVWHIFNPTVPINSNSQNWIDLATANYSGVDYSEVYIATPVQINAPPTGDQEFLFFSATPIPLAPVTSPEPGSLILLGTGALGIAAALRRKLRI